MNTKNSSNWQKIKLGRVCKLVKGVTYKTEDYATTDDGSVFLTLKSIAKGGGFNFDGVKYFKGKSKTEQHVTPNDLIIANTDLTRAGDIIGAPLFVPKIGNQDHYIISMDITKLVSDEVKLNRNYLYHYLSTDTVRNYMRSISNGSTVLHLKVNLVNDIDVPLPLLSVQKKISTILSCIDETIQKTDQIIQNTEKLKSGLMNELLTKGIEHKKFKKTKLGEIPLEWELLTMKDICTVRQGLQIAIRQRKQEAGTNRHVYITNKFLKDLEKPEYIEDPIKSVICDRKDILMTRTGNTGQVVTDVQGVFHNNFFLIDFDHKRLNRDFLVYYLQKPDIQRMIMDRAGTTTIPDLNHGDFYSLPVLIPDKEEQNAISEIITLISQKIKSEQGNFEKLITLKKGLMQDIFGQKAQINC